MKLKQIYSNACCSNLQFLSARQSSDVVLPKTWAFPEFHSLELWREVERSTALCCQSSSWSKKKIRKKKTFKAEQRGFLIK